MEDDTLEVRSVREAARWRDVHVHAVGVAQRHAAGLTSDFRDRVVLERHPEEVQHLIRRDTHAQQQFHHHVEVVFLVGTPRGDGGVDRHRTLRVISRDHLGERAARPVDVIPDRRVATICLCVKPRGQLDPDGDVGEQPIQRIGKRVRAVEKITLASEAAHLFGSPLDQHSRCRRHLGRSSRQKMQSMRSPYPCPRHHHSLLTGAINAACGPESGPVFLPAHK
jgi:hypothetical protein